MKIYIPSKGRAGKVSTIEVLLGLECLIVCPESEVEEYRKFYKNVIGCPDKIVGITPTRNWILDNSEDKDIVMVDDDALGMYYFEKNEKIPFTKKEDVERLFLTMFQLVKDMGTNLWGLQLAGDKKFYREYTPFSFSSVIGANIFGIVNDGQRFDERLKVKEDYDFCLMSLYKFKRVLRNNKYFIQVNHLTNKGGCVSYRTRETEREALNVLQKKWGSRIVQGSRTRTFIKIFPPVKGI